MLAGITLIAAVAALSHAIASTDIARRSAVESSMNATNAALADAFAGLGTARLHDADVAELNLRARASVARFADARAGFCSTGGDIVVVAGTGPQGDLELTPKPLPPDQQDAIRTACRGQAHDGRVELDHPHDLTFVAVRLVAPDGAAWSLRRIAASNDGDPWKLHVLALSIATALLVAVTITAMIGLGRGVAQMQRAVTALQGDLRATVDQPLSTEFASLTRDLVGMARHLADARDRENALAKDLTHRERLAGLGRVVAGVAHEVRNPLAGIKLKLDVMLRDRATSPRAQGEIQSCLDEIARLDRVVQLLLVVGRKSKAEPRTLALGDVIDQRLRAAAAADGRASVKGRRQGDAAALIDSDDFVRVIDNLLRNAFEASPDGGEVLVRLSVEGGAVVVDVIDHGAGTDDSSLFEPFYTTKPTGTGLGLWLSRSVVESYGGTIAYLRDAAMTTFRVTLICPPGTTDE